MACVLFWNWERPLQGMGGDAPPGQKEPTGHGRRAAPSLERNEPGGTTLHALWPWADWKLSFGQGRQPGWPGWFWNWPVGHTGQRAWLVRAWAVPKAQGRQVRSVDEVGLPTT